MRGRPPVVTGGRSWTAWVGLVLAPMSECVRTIPPARCRSVSGVGIGGDKTTRSESGALSLAAVRERVREDLEMVALGVALLPGPRFGATRVVAGIIMLALFCLAQLCNSPGTVI